MKDVVILGMLSQMQEGEWWIGMRFRHLYLSTSFNG